MSDKRPLIVFRHWTRSLGPTWWIVGCRRCPWIDHHRTHQDAMNAALQHCASGRPGLEVTV